VSKIHQYSELQETQNCSPSLTVILFPVDKQEKSDLGTAFSFALAELLEIRKTKSRLRKRHRS